MQYGDASAILQNGAELGQTVTGSKSDPLKFAPTEAVRLNFPS